MAPMTKTLLIANRGEIARRIIRTARTEGWRTVDRTRAACCPPMTLIRAFGHIHSPRGEYARPAMP